MNSKIKPHSERPTPIYEYRPSILSSDIQGGLYRDALLHKFNPFYLCEHLRRLDNGVVVLNTQSIIQEPEDAKQLLILLYDYYLAEWKAGCNITLAFEVDNEVIIVSGYNLDNNMFSRRFQRISTRRLDNPFSYTYSKEDFERLKSIIEQT